MSRFAIALLSLVVVGGAPACEVVGLGSRSPEDISLEVPRATWGRDDTIRVRLSNETRHSLGYNLCFKVLERRTAGEWAAVQSMPEHTACTAEMRTLDAGDEAWGGQIVFSFIPAGRYRFRMSVEWPIGEGNVGLTSDQFDIAEK